MLIDTDHMVPVTTLQKELTRRIRQVASSDEPLFVLKNNELEAVILSAPEYEYLSSLNDLIEQMEIEDSIKTRLVNYKRSKNISWETLKNEAHN